MPGWHGLVVKQLPMNKEVTVEFPVKEHAKAAVSDPNDSFSWSLSLPL